MPDSPRHALLALAYQLLLSAEGGPPPECVVTVSDGNGTTFTFRAKEGEFSRGGERVTKAAQRKILAAFDHSGQTLTTPEIARKAGYKVNSRLYAHLSELVQLDLLETTNDGYRLK